MVVKGAMNGATFRVYIEHMLVPTLSPGDIVVCDNLSVHKVAGVRQLLEHAGCELRFLPPYSPDFNPIEMAFSKLKALLRAQAHRSIPALWQALPPILERFPPAECANYFRAAGYDPV